MTENQGNEKKVALDEEQENGAGKKDAQGDTARGNNDGMIFDDVMRTIQERRGELLIPVVNDAFGEQYSKDTKVTRLPESFQKMVSKVVADGCSVIGNHIYHLEVQSSNDSTMAIRMVEYDFMIGMSAAEKGEEGYRIRFLISGFVAIDPQGSGASAEEAGEVEGRSGDSYGWKGVRTTVRQVTGSGGGWKDRGKG